MHGDDRHPVVADGANAPQSRGREVPRAELHIALIAPDERVYRLLRSRVAVIKPPYWDGTVHLHVVIDDPHSRWANVDWTLRQALADCGLASPHDVDLMPSEQLHLGYDPK